MTDREQIERLAKWALDHANIAAAHGQKSKEPGLIIQLKHTEKQLRDIAIALRAPTFAEGAEAMREAAAKWHDKHAADPVTNQHSRYDQRVSAGCIRALPLPEPKP